jgi:DNA-binding transcriptional regulator YhcF (GntR family)
MAPSTSQKTVGNGLERVRAQLITSLHLGNLRPGDRVPSVRRLADLTGMNRKTVHRAYQTLAEEGLLTLRPGSGTFLSDGRRDGEDRPLADELQRVANRCRAEAVSLGVGPELLAAFLQTCFGPTLRGVPIAVIECNREQTGLIADELQGGLGVHARAVALADLLADPVRALGGSAAIVTTDCHRAEVEGRSSGLPVFCVALDRAFPRRLIELGSEGEVVLVVRDVAFAPAFHRLLAQMGTPQATVDRIHVVEPQEAREALAAHEGATVVVSPLVERSLSWRLPEGRRRLSLRWRLHAGAVDRLRVELAYELALRRAAPSPAAVRFSSH